VGCGGARDEGLYSSMPASASAMVNIS